MIFYPRLGLIFKLIPFYFSEIKENRDRLRKTKKIAKNIKIYIFLILKCSELY